MPGAGQGQGRGRAGQLAKTCSKMSTTLAFWKSDLHHARILSMPKALSSLTSNNIDNWANIGFRNLCRRRKTLFEFEHNARVLEIRFAPRSHFKHVESAILVDVAKCCTAGVGVRDLCRRRKTLFENEHHARVLDIRFAPRSHFERVGSAIPVDVTKFCRQGRGQGWKAGPGLGGK